MHREVSFSRRRISLPNGGFQFGNTGSPRPATGSLPAVTCLINCMLASCHMIPVSVSVALGQRPISTFATFERLPKLWPRLSATSLAFKHVLDNVLAGNVYATIQELHPPLRCFAQRKDGCFQAAVEWCGKHSSSGRTPALAQVWLPVISVNGMASVLSLQRMTELHASTADVATKMATAAKVADSTTALLLAGDKDQDQKPRMLLAGIS